MTKFIDWEPKTEREIEVYVKVARRKINALEGMLNIKDEIAVTRNQDGTTTVKTALYVSYMMYIQTLRKMYDEFRSQVRSAKTEEEVRHLVDKYVHDALNVFWRIDGYQYIMEVKHD